ncbi:hypothetical protein KI387_029141, partial [Taxus chinensis]
LTNYGSSQTQQCARDGRKTRRRRKLFPCVTSLPNEGLTQALGCPWKGNRTREHHTARSTTSTSSLVDLARRRMTFARQTICFIKA